MERGTQVALEVWGPSYTRATWMQAPLALLGFLAGICAWWLGGGGSWLAGALLLAAVVMPTNRALIAQGKLATAGTRVLLERWGRLHAVRSVLSLAALALFAWRATAG